MGILVLYSIIAFSQAEGILIDAISIGFHVLGCIMAGIIASIMSRKDWLKGFYLSARLVLLIGFGTCIGLASIIEKSNINIR